MTRTINVYNTSAREAGKRGVGGKASRRDLERTLMDILTFDMDFEEALNIVEEATYEELVEKIWKYKEEGPTTIS